jgi:hypothetical protein
VIAADLVNFHFINGWFKVATFLAITVPSATVIMAVDHFLLPRLFRISRPLTEVPSWEETGLINVPAVLALLAAVFFGVTGTANWPHGWIYSTPQNGWGPVPVWSWLIAGTLYLGLVAVAKAVTPNVQKALAFSTLAVVANPPSVLDIASEAEEYSETARVLPAAQP